MASYNYTDPEGQEFKLDVDEDLEPHQVYQRFAEAGVAPPLESTQAQVPAKEAPGYLSQLGSALSLGGRQMMAGVKGTFNAAVGDTPDVAEAMAQTAALNREQQENQTAEDIGLNEDFAKNKEEWEKASGVWGATKALSGYAGSIASHPGAAFKQAIQSAPNAVVGTGTSLAGYGLGALAGAAAGIETGPGAILTGLAGAVAGGVVSNSLLEASPAIYDVLNERTNGAAANMTAPQIAEVLKKDPTIVQEGLKTGVIRGSVIGVIEGLGMKGAGAILSIPERAAARAAQKTLLGAGVDIASKEAVKKAMEDTALKKAVSVAAQTAKAQYSTAGNLARGAAATGLETAASGAGEVGAQVAAGQPIDPTAAVQEMMGEVGINAATAPALKTLSAAKYALTPQQPETSVGATPTGEPVPVQVNGQTIAHIPPGSTLTPEDVAMYAAEPGGADTLKAMARKGYINLPEVVAPVPGVDPAITQDMNDNIAAGAALAPKTFEEVRLEQMRAQDEQAAARDAEARQKAYDDLKKGQQGADPYTEQNIPADKLESLQYLLGLHNKEHSDDVKREAEKHFAALLNDDPKYYRFVRSGNSKVFLDTRTGEYVKLTSTPGDAESQAVLDQTDLLKKHGARFAEVPQITTIFKGNGTLDIHRQKPVGAEGASIFKDLTPSDKALFLELQKQNPLSSDKDLNPVLRVETDSSLKNMGLVLGADGQVRAMAFDFDGIPESATPKDRAEAVHTLNQWQDMPGVPLAAFSPKVQNLIRSSSPQVSPVTTETKTPSNAANVAGGSQSAQTESAGGSGPTVTGDIVSTSDIPSTAEIQPEVGTNPTTEEAEFEELQALMEKRGQAQNKVKGVTFSKKEEARFQELGAKLRHLMFETTDPVNDPIVGEDINDQPIRQSKEGTFYTVENGRVRTGPAFKEEALLNPVENWTPSTAEIQPTQTNATGTKTVEEGVRAEPAPGNQSREVESPESRDSVLRAEEERREEVENWTPQPNAPATANINGHAVVGTVGAPLPAGRVNFHYNWNGKPQVAVVRHNQLSRPVTALADAPRYVYTQEQNSRKAGKHIPVTPGVHENFNFQQAFASMAEDKSLSRIYREIARLLSKMPVFGNMDLHIVADGRRPYAGEYTHNNGKSAIAINLRQVARGKVDALGTLLHEALHHLTIAKVLNPQGDVELEAVHALNEIRLKLAKLPGAQKFAYELGSNEEFITGVFTHPGFQDFLASTPSDFSPATHAGKFRSVLSEVFRRIAELATGKHVPPGSTLDHSMASILALFETPHRNHQFGPLQKLSAKSLAENGVTPEQDAEFKPPPGFAFTRARFAPTKPEQQTIKIEGDESATKKAYDWINAVTPYQAANLILTTRTPGWMTPNERVIAISGLIAGFSEVSVDPVATEDEKIVARATNQMLGVKRMELGAEAARNLRQFGKQNGDTLQPHAAVLAADEVLADRGKKVLEKQFDGGEEGAATRTAGAAEKATAEADERLENIISRLMGGMSPKLTAQGALAKMFRGKGQLDQIIEEVGKALQLKARGTLVTPERKTALANLVSSLKNTLSASVKGDKIPAPQRTMQDLLTSAFVNQVSEGTTFEEAWKAGRQKVLDMLIDMELDKQYHPAEKRLKDLRAKLTHLEAGNEEQQKASTAERAQLATQIADTKAQMKSAMAAVTAMTPQFEAQRDKLMPSAPTVAFDPVASREAISRAFEQAGYTAELATGLDKSGKRALSIKDALLNRKRATDAVMKQFDEAMAAKDATTQHDWPQARALAERAVKETLDSWQKQIDEDKATKLQATKDNLLGEDSKALEKLVNSVRGKIAPDEDWSDILHDLPRKQEERLAAIKERVAKHEALKNLTPDEATKLAESIDKLWQRERLKAFQDELLKAGVLRARSTKAAVNVASAAPELLRLMNLGVFNSSTFREAVSKRFGIKMMSNTQAQALRKLAAEAWEQPQGVLRNNKLDELVKNLQHITGSSWSESVSSYWIASVLSGLNTQFNTWGALLNGGATNLVQAGALLARGNGAAALATHQQWWKALNEGMKESLHILWTGDTTFTKRFEQDIHNALDGEKGAHPIAIGERMWREGTVLQKVPGALMMMVGRSMVAADHINNIATTQGAMAVARAMNPELYDGKTSWTQKEIDDARRQAINETTGGADPTTAKERLIVGVRTREILNSGLSQEHREQASLVGDQAAFQNDPTGLFGGLYHGVKNMLSYWVRQLDEHAQDEEANRIARAICAVGASSVYAATGTRFMRYGFNLGNEFIRYMPGSWVLNKIAPILGKNLSPMQQELLIGKNLVGAMMLASLYAMFGGDDEDKDGVWHLEGPWDALSPDEKNERRTAGIAPNTMWKREKGQIQRIGYGQWALAGLIAAAGSMLDEKRYEPAKWKERGVAGHMLRGAATGLYQLQNVAALENLAKMLGQSPSSSSDKISGPAERLAEMGTAYAGGFAPTFLKDLDKWDDPRNFKANGVWEKLVREVPVARRFVNDGRPQFNRLGQDVRVHREPYSRLYTADQVDKATEYYGHLLSRGLDFPSPSADRKVIKGNKKVPMETLGKGVVYDFEKAVAVQYGKYLAEHGEELLKLPTKAADKAMTARARRIMEVETHKVQAKVNHP